MPARVQFTWESRQDLLDLFALVAEETGLERAELILHRIHEVLSALADWPGIGRRRDDMDGTPRSFAVPPWLIIYEAQPENRGVQVWRVVDGRRDVPALVHPPRRWLRSPRPSLAEDDSRDEPQLTDSRNGSKPVQLTPNWCARPSSGAICLKFARSFSPRD